MARVQAPFLSIAASGTVGGMLTSRMTKNGAQIIKKPWGGNAGSAQQLIEQQRMKDARAGYRSLTSGDLTLWQGVGSSKQISAWAAFFQEWQVQQVSAGNMPLIPDINI